jgi:hypothetical protein
MRYFKKFEFQNHEFMIKVAEVKTESEGKTPCDMVYEIETYTESLEMIKTSMVKGYELEEEIQKHVDHAESYISKLYHKDKNYNEIILMNLGFECRK